MFVGRALHQTALTPGLIKFEFFVLNLFLTCLGKVVQSLGACFIPWGGKEHKKKQYEVFVGSGKWVSSSGSLIPPKAIPGKT